MLECHLSLAAYYATLHKAVSNSLEFLLVNSLTYASKTAHIRVAACLNKPVFANLDIFRSQFGFNSNIYDERTINRKQQLTAHYQKDLLH